MSTSPQPITPNMQTADQQIQAHLAEYQALNSNSLALFKQSEQMIVLGIAAASIILTFLGSQLTVVSATPLLLTSLLYGIAILYSILGLTFISNIYNEYVIGLYTYEVIAPRINALVSAVPGTELIQFGIFHNKEVQSLLGFFLANVAAGTGVLLFSAPPVLALFFVSFGMPSITTQVAQSGISSLAALLPTLLSIVAWVLFAFLLLSFGSIIVLPRRRPITPK
jgi:hypothetical protein